MRLRVVGVLIKASVWHVFVYLQRVELGGQMSAHHIASRHAQRRRWRSTIWVVPVVVEASARSIRERDEASELWVHVHVGIVNRV